MLISRALFAGIVLSSCVAAADVPVVLMGDRAQRDRAKQALRALRGQFSDLAVDLRFRWLDGIDITDGRSLAGRARAVARVERAEAVFWCDFSAPTSLFVLLPARPHRAERFLVRALDESPQRGRYEALALIVRSTVTSLLHIPSRSPPDGRRARPGPRARAPSSRQSRPARVVPSAGLSLEAGYRQDYLGSSEIVRHSFGGGLVLSLFRRWQIHSSLYLAQSSTEHGSRASVEIRRVPLMIGARYLLPIGRRWGIAPTASIQLQHTRVRAARLASGVSAAPPASLLLVGLAPEVGGWLNIHERLQLFVNAGVVIQLDRERYVVAGVEPTEVVLTPWRVQPAVRAGVAVRVW